MTESNTENSSCMATATASGQTQETTAFGQATTFKSPIYRVYLTRHGESLANLQGKIGGDTSLSPSGKIYSARLPAVLMHKVLPKSVVKNGHVLVWISALVRTLETVQHFPRDIFHVTSFPELNEINAGVCDNLTYSEVQEQFPDEAEARDLDKWNFRYSGGESYGDVVARIRPIMKQLEDVCKDIHETKTSSGDVLAIVICAHQAVLRCVYAHLMGQAVPEIEVPYIKIPLHTVIRVDFVPGPNGGIIADERFKVAVPAVDTHKEAQWGQTLESLLANGNVDGKLSVLDQLPDPTIQIISPGSFASPFDAQKAAQEIVRTGSAASNTSETSHASTNQIKAAHFPLPLEIPSGAAKAHPSLAEHAKSHISFQGIPGTVDEEELESPIIPTLRRQSYFRGDSH